MTKQATYTDDEITNLVVAYAKNKNVAELALAFGRSTNSIIGKLNALGVYVKGAKPVAMKTSKKDELIITIELAAKVEMPSLKNMNTNDLQKLLDFIKLEGQ